MPQIRRFIRADDPIVTCYECGAAVTGVAYIDLYGPQMVYFDTACALRLGLLPDDRSDSASGVAALAGGG